MTGSEGQGSELLTCWMNKDACERGQPTLSRTRVRTHLRPHPRARHRSLREQRRNCSRTAAAPREVYDVQHDKSGSPEGNTGPREPVRAFDYASVIEVLREEKSFVDY